MRLLVPSSCVSASVSRSCMHTTCAPSAPACCGSCGRRRRRAARAGGAESTLRVARGLPWLLCAVHVPRESGAGHRCCLPSLPCLAIVSRRTKISKRSPRVQCITRIRVDSSSLTHLMHLLTVHLVFGCPCSIFLSLSSWVGRFVARSVRCRERAGLRRAGEWAQLERTVASSGLGTARLPCDAGFDAPAYLTLCFASSLLLT